MCTVTYIPINNKDAFVLTSNRDEKECRPTLPPQVYEHENISIAYPKDQEAGGSWIAINNKGKINCLLNGAFVAHKKKDYHTVSRGTILLEFTKSELSADDFFSGKDLNSVEPFTIVSIKQFNGKVLELTEFIWDGSDKHLSRPEKDRPHMWSSAIYTKEQKETREKWFANFLDHNKENLSSNNILEFHSGNHTNDNSINLIMQRQGGFRTVSITQITAEGSHLQMSYLDLLKESKIDVIL
ncbi:MAG: NRDE family protein [Bacteroidales bacterium]|nr:NRDE family protein [Bacteroidales bacterium]